MNDLTKWILSLLGAVVVGFIIELLFSETRLNKFFRYISATVTLLIVVSPIQSLFGGNFSFNFNSSTITTDQNFVDFMLKKRIEILENHCVLSIENAGIKGAEVEITATANDSGEVEIELVQINLSRAVINGQTEHINSNEIALNAVYNYLKIDKNRIAVYGGETKN